MGIILYMAIPVVCMAIPVALAVLQGMRAGCEVGLHEWRRSGDPRDPTRMIPTTIDYTGRVVWEFQHVQACMKCGRRRLSGFLYHGYGRVGDAAKVAAQYHARIGIPAEFLRQMPLRRRIAYAGIMQACERRAGRGAQDRDHEPPEGE